MPETRTISVSEADREDIATLCLRKDLPAYAWPALERVVAAWDAALAAAPAAKDEPHPSHTLRTSWESTFDHICDQCGATDNAPGGWGQLTQPCPDAAPPPTGRVEVDRRALNTVVRELRHAYRGGSLGGEVESALRKLDRALAANRNERDDT